MNYSEYGQGQALKSAYETDSPEMPSHDGVGQALHATRNALDNMDELISIIENRLHGPRPSVNMASSGQSAPAPEPGVLRLASDNAMRAQRLQDRLAKVNATL